MRKMLYELPYPAGRTGYTYGYDHKLSFFWNLFLLAGSKPMKG